MASPNPKLDASPRRAVYPRAVQHLFTEFDEVVAAIPDFDSEYIQSERGEICSEVTRVELDRMVAMQCREDAPGHIYRATAPRAATTLAFVGGASNATRWRGAPVTSRTLLAYGPGAEHVGFSRGRLHSISLLFTTGALEAHAARLGHEIRLDPRTACRLEPDAPAMDGLRQAAQQLFAVAASARASLDVPEFRRFQEEALLTAAVQALATGEERVEQAAAAHERAVRRAVDWIEAHIDEPVYIADLCEAAQVSERTLRSAFGRVCGVSPIRFLHLHRMKQVRRALLAADPAQDRVATIAMRHGFANLGRFAVEFRRLFGESPSQLLRSPR